MNNDSTLSQLESLLDTWRSGKVDPVSRVYWALTSERISHCVKKHDNCRKNILDVGCGAGTFLVELAKEGKYCCGVDPLWQTSLKRAQKNAYDAGVSVNFCRSVGEHLPFTHECFDIVLCISTLQHVDNVLATLREIHRVLGREGILIVSVPQTVRRPIFKATEIYTTHFNLRTLKDALNSSGFQILEQNVCGFFPPLSQQILNQAYPFLKDYRLRKIICGLDTVGVRLPSIASSIIVAAALRK